MARKRRSRRTRTTRASQGLALDLQQAEAVLREAAEGAASDEPEAKEWEALVSALGQASAKSKTYIAALGTAILAKATNPNVDPFCLKVGKHPRPGSYSARRLAKDVLAALAPSLHIDIGVTGREPLNNQPFFAHDRISRDMRILRAATEALRILNDCLDKLAGVTTTHEARMVLRAFIRLRRASEVPPLPDGADSPGHVDQLSTLVGRFVDAESEGGRRAQAAGAGLLAAAFGPERVVTSRVSDPSRHYPGDVIVLAPVPDKSVFLAMEVRDKAVTFHDVYTFARAAHRAKVARALVLAVAQRGALVDVSAAVRWCAQRNLALRTYFHWTDFVVEVATWAADDPAGFSARAHRLIHERLVDLGASVKAEATWRDWRAHFFP